MFQTRFHGRGGQGVVTAAEMLSLAAFKEGKYAQAFPSFGSERMGAPVASFCRISDREIRAREPVLEPDALIVQDTSLLQTKDIFDGLSPKGIVLINSSRDVSELGIGSRLAHLPRGHVLTVPATELALKHVKRPVPNAVMLAGFTAMTDVIKLKSVLEAITDTFKGAVGEANKAAAEEAFKIVSAKQKELLA